MKPKPFHNEKMPKSFEMVSLSTNSLHQLPSLTSIIKKVSTFWRWAAVPFVGVLQFTNYFCYYNPQPLQTTLLKPPLQLTSTEYNILFSIYSFPNIVMTPIGGWMIDKKGLYFSMIVFIIFMIIGQSLIVFLGGVFNNYSIILVGRFISGIGSENLSMAQKVILANWFVGNERIFAYGTNTAFAQLAIIMTSSLIPIVYESGGKSYFYPFLFSFLIAVLALFSSIIIIYLDKNVVRKAKSFAKLEDPFPEEKKKENEKEEQKEEDDKLEENGTIKKKLIEKNKKEGVVGDSSSFNLVFWLLVISNYLSYGTFFTFVDNANDLLVENYHYDFKQAGNIITFIFIISAVGSPLFGFLLKNFGRKMIMMFISLILFLFALIILIVIEINDLNDKIALAIFGLILIGLFYAMNFSLIWTCISMVVQEDKMGSAFGIVYSSRNINLVISPLIAGLIHDGTGEIRGGYLWLQIFLLIQIIGAIILIVWAGFKDYRGKRILV